MFVTEGKNSFFISTKASIIDDSFETASNWASKHIYTNPAFKWIVGNYLEADQANSNGQQFSLDDIRESHNSLTNTPLNIDHDRSNIVGSMVASDIVYPIKEEANPHLEALSVFWKRYFPETLRRVEAAHESGSLYYSMEAIGESVTCVGSDSACGETFAYKGPKDVSYCDHINSVTSNRLINKPDFMGAALIVPPNRPGWKAARIHEVALEEDASDYDRVMHDIFDSSDLSDDDWDTLMWEITMKRFISVS